MNPPPLSTHKNCNPPVPVPPDPRCLDQTKDLLSVQNSEKRSTRNHFNRIPVRFYFQLLPFQRLLYFHLRKTECLDVVKIVIARVIGDSQTSTSGNERRPNVADRVADTLVPRPPEWKTKTLK